MVAISRASIIRWCCLRCLQITLAALTKYCITKHDRIRQFPTTIYEILVPDFLTDEDLQRRAETYTLHIHYMKQSDVTTITEAMRKTSDSVLHKP